MLLYRRLWFLPPVTAASVTDGAVQQPTKTFRDGDMLLCAYLADSDDDDHQSMSTTAATEMLTVDTQHYDGDKTIQPISADVSTHYSARSYTNFRQFQ